MKIQFDTNAVTAIKAIVLVMDLEDFSKFFSVPDVHLYIPKLINRVFDALNTCFYGGKAYWIDDEPHLDPLPEPIHTKYLGDGALFIWRYDHQSSNTLQPVDVERLMNRLSSLQKKFSVVIAKCLDEIPLTLIPPKMRFGIGAGSVYRLVYPRAGGEEYVGYTINLASRLQSYCHALGFIASARVELPEKSLADAGYKKIIAKKLKGFPQEVVIVDTYDYEILDSRTKHDLFDEDLLEQA